MRVVWTESAQRDAVRHATYIAQFNPLAAAGLLRRLFGAANGLATFPQRGRPGPGGLRELTLVPPYIIIYHCDPDADVIHILRVWHGAQDRDRTGATDQED